MRSDDEEVLRSIVGCTILSVWHESIGVNDHIINSSLEFDFQDGTVVTISPCHLGLTAARRQIVDDVESDPTSCRVPATRAGTEWAEVVGKTIDSVSLEFNESSTQITEVVIVLAEHRAIDLRFLDVRVDGEYFSAQVLWSSV